jgi:hypothetical protein
MVLGCSRQTLDVCNLLSARNGNGRGHQGQITRLVVQCDLLLSVKEDAFDGADEVGALIFKLTNRTDQTPKVYAVAYGTCRSRA